MATSIDDFEDVEVGIFNIHRPREFASADNPHINERSRVQVTRAVNVARLVQCANRRPWSDVVETCIAMTQIANVIGARDQNVRD